MKSLGGIAFLLGLAACGNGGGTPPPQTPENHPAPVAQDPAVAQRASCKHSIDGMLDRMLAQEMAGERGQSLTPEMKKHVRDQMMGMGDIMIGVCASDHWTAELLGCLDAARSDEDGKRCEKLMTPEQTANMQKAAQQAMASDEPPPPPVDEAPPTPPSGPVPELTAAQIAALPPECNEYRKAIAKLATCDKMPAEARDAMKDAFNQAAAGWGNLPPEARSGLANACKAGADAVKQSAAACKK